MALTRSMLKGMNLTDEQVSAIIDAHTETVDGLKEERDKYKEDAKKLPGIQKELADLKGGKDWKSEFDKEHKAFEDYKKDISEKEKLASVKSAYRKLLKDNAVGEKHIDSILRVTDFKGIELGEDGKFVDESKIVDAIKSDWAGFIETTQTKGAQVETPPTSTKGNSMTKEQIMAIKDTGERQKAIAANMDLFRGR